MFNGCRGLGYGGLGYGGSGYSRFGGIFMMIIPVLVITIILYVVFKLLNESRYNEVKDNSKAINILSEKYALGDISEEEYLKKRKLLGK
ncbi:SHOCT domain-containing protein [Clostridium sp.]|uniref:SHOCT domain-containing protein n=1 Tax=Clostridium sp. TaxID=1506 RepID=UPI0026052C47|nr:SHOCT domain-containing protein [Clostridium sp.]